MANDAKVVVEIDCRRPRNRWDVQCFVLDAFEATPQTMFLDGAQGRSPSPLDETRLPAPRAALSPTINSTSNDFGKGSGFLSALTGVDVLSSRVPHDLAGLRECRESIGHRHLASLVALQPHLFEDLTAGEALCRADNPEQFI